MNEIKKNFSPESLISSCADGKMLTVHGAGASSNGSKLLHDTEIIVSEKS